MKCWRWNLLLVASFSSRPPLCHVCARVPNASGPPGELGVPPTDPRLVCPSPYAAPSRFCQMKSSRRLSYCGISLYSSSVGVRYGSACPENTREPRMRSNTSASRGGVTVPESSCFAVTCARVRRCTILRADESHLAAVKLGVCVLALDYHGPFERDTGEETLGLTGCVSQFRSS